MSQGRVSGGPAMRHSGTHPSSTRASDGVHGEPWARDMNVGIQSVRWISPVYLGTPQFGHRRPPPGGKERRKGLQSVPPPKAPRKGRDHRSRATVTQRSRNRARGRGKREREKGRRGGRRGGEKKKKKRKRGKRRGVPNDVEVKLTKSRTLVRGPLSGSSRPR